MIEIPSVYIETSIVSYLTARDSPSLVGAARQLQTRRWWERRNEFRLYMSDVATIHLHTRRITRRRRCMTRLLMKSDPSKNRWLKNLVSIFAELLRTLNDPKPKPSWKDGIMCNRHRFCQNRHSDEHALPIIELQRFHIKRVTNIMT